MAPKRGSPAWPFERKFRLWRAEHQVSLSAFAKQIGVPLATLHGWARSGVRLPADGLAKIAAATSLPAEYWTNPALPFPPPADYANMAAEVDKALRGLDVEQLRQVLEMLRNHEDLDQTLALRNVARKPRPS